MTPILTGVVCGVAWAAALRGYMSELAGTTSSVAWAGTFVGVLLPGAVTGGLLGWAEVRRRRGAVSSRPWLVLAPLSFAVAPVFLPGAVEGLVGLVGGAIAIAVFAIGGGYSLSGRGSRAGRLACGVLAAAVVAGVAVAGRAVGGPGLALTEPRGAWVALLGCTLLVVLAMASSIPWRAPERAVGPDTHSPQFRSR